MIYGDGRDDRADRARRTDNSPTGAHPASGATTASETISAPALPEHYAVRPGLLHHCLLHDQPFEGMVSPDLSRDAQEILEAGMASMAQRKGGGTAAQGRSGVLR